MVYIIVIATDTCNILKSTPFVLRHFSMAYVYVLVCVQNIQLWFIISMAYKEHLTLTDFIFMSQGIHANAPHLVIKSMVKMQLKLKKMYHGVFCEIMSN